MKRERFLKKILRAIAAVPLFLYSCTGRARPSTGNASGGSMMGGSMMGGGMMGGGMMNVSQRDMSAYMEMFDQHTAIRRRVERVAGGITTVTESDAPHIAALLKAHVSSMYQHLADGQEVRCMSDSLPVMFRNADKYRRTLQITKNGVAVTETSDDPMVADAIIDHAREVSGFVNDGMPAMMHQMMK